MNRINGDMLRDMILSGAHAVERHKSEINDLNVFPVPDGDTGTNMSLTLKAGCDALAGMQGKSCGEVASQAAAFSSKGREATQASSHRCSSGALQKSSRALRRWIQNSLRPPLWAVSARPTRPL